MYNRRSNHVFDDQSIHCWHEKMSRFDRNLAFKKDIFAKGRMIWATNVIKSIELKHNCVIASVRYNNEDCRISFDIDRNGNLVSDVDLQDKKICAIVCALCIEIDDILSTYTSIENETNLQEYEENLLPTKSYKSDIEKCLLVKFSIIDQNLVLRSFLDNDVRKPIFMQTNRVLSRISGDARKISILRLLFNAKKANCKFCFEYRDYRISDLRDALSFYNNKLTVWQKYFNVELSPECELLSRGLISISTCAKISKVDDSKINIIWNFVSKFGPIDNKYITALLRANGRPIFLPNIGVVYMSIEQVEAIRAVLTLQITENVFPYYMLYFLLNQSSILVDTDLEKTTSFVENLPELLLLPCLKEYQKIGVRWMRSVLDAGCQCLLADEMGLGKTLQVLSLICTDNTAKRNLIICPASVVPVWESEIEKFFPEKMVSILDSSGLDDGDFVITSYNQARRLNSTFVDKRFDYVVLDEAQYIKNSLSKTARACCNIDTKHKIAVTGTPIENNLNDVWSIFKFLMPGLLYNYRDFQKKIVSKEFRSKLKTQISPFILRRTKNSVHLQLPERNEIELLCPLNHVQSKLYDTFKDQLAVSCQNYAETASTKDRMNILTTIMRMRQTCDCVDILPKKYTPNNDIDCPKLDALMLKLEEIVAANKKTVVFSQFLGFLSKIETRIIENLPQCKIFKLTGVTNKRKILVENFQNYNGPTVMLISLKAGGVGITLHAAEYAFLMEPWWNPAVEEQAIARIHRIGQQKVTTIYRMITQGTIEQHMRNMQIQKKHLFDEVIKENGVDVSFEKFYIQNVAKLLK